MEVVANEGAENDLNKNPLINTTKTTDIPKKILFIFPLLKNISVSIKKYVCRPNDLGVPVAPYYIHIGKVTGTPCHMKLLSPDIHLSL